MNKFFISHKNPLAVLLALIIAGGIFVYDKLQTSLFPEITFPKIKIIADAGLQPVDKMMVSVTKPLEAAVKQVPDLQMIRSTTSRGSCEISAFMTWNSDIDVNQQHIESKISEIRNTLPPDVDITVAKMNPSILPIMGYSVESNTRSPIELKQLAIYENASGNDKSKKDCKRIFMCDKEFVHCTFNLLLHDPDPGGIG